MKQEDKFPIVIDGKNHVVKLNKKFPVSFEFKRGRKLLGGQLKTNQIEKYIKIAEGKYSPVVREFRRKIEWLLKGNGLIK